MAEPAFNLKQSNCGVCTLTTTQYRVSFDLVIELLLYQFSDEEIEVLWG
jgi:hypothetical protein